MKKDRRIAVRLDEDTLAMLELIAETSRINKSKAIRKIIRTYFANIYERKE